MRRTRCPLPASDKIARFGPAVAGLLTAFLVVIIEGFRAHPSNRLVSDVLQSATVVWAAITASLMVVTARLVLTNKKQRRLADNLFQAEQARQRSESMFSAAFRLSPDAMAINAVPGAQFLEINDS